MSVMVSDHFCRAAWACSVEAAPFQAVWACSVEAAPGVGTPDIWGHCWVKFRSISCWN
jgi:hypothetical protein